MKNKQLSISKPLNDCYTMKIVSEIIHAFYIFTHRKDQLVLCLPQTCQLLKVFLNDRDLVEKCQIDLNTTTNSQDTEPDSDDELTELQSESEPVRQEIFTLLLAILQDDISQGEVPKQMIKEIANMALPLVIKEMSQESNFRSLKTCLDVLVQISGLSDNEELCSTIIEDQARVRMIDSILINGSIQHRFRALILLENLVLNSPADALKIARDLGLMMRVLEGMHARKDFETTKEAHRLFFYLVQAMHKQEHSVQTEVLDQFLKLESPNSNPPIRLMPLLVNNLHTSNVSNTPVIQVITLKVLELLFQHDTEKYAYEFQLRGGIEPLQDLQVDTLHDSIYQLAFTLIQNYFEGEDVVDQSQPQPQEEETKE